MTTLNEIKPETPSKTLLKTDNLTDILLISELKEKIKGVEI